MKNIALAGPFGHQCFPCKKFPSKFRFQNFFAFEILLINTSLWEFQPSIWKKKQLWLSRQTIETRKMQLSIKFWLWGINAINYISDCFHHCLKSQYLDRMKRGHWFLREAILYFKKNQTTSILTITVQKICNARSIAKTLINERNSVYRNLFIHSMIWDIGKIALKRIEAFNEDGSYKYAIIRAPRFQSK